MYNLKLNLCSQDRRLAEELQATSKDTVHVITSIGLLGNTEITVAIIAAAPVIITQVANVIKAYIEKNKMKSFSLKLNDVEMSFTGYSTEEIDIILQKYAKQDEQ